MTERGIRIFIRERYIMVKQLLTSKIIIVGAGAVGGFYAAKLAQAGAQVSVVCRSNYEQIKTNGITIESEEAKHHFVPHAVYSHQETIDDVFDYVIVTTKVLADGDTVELIRPLINSETSIVLLQNGIGIEAPIHAAFPDNEIISAVTYIGAYQNAPGIITHITSGQTKMTLGNYLESCTEKTQYLSSLLIQAEIPCKTVNNIVQIRWEKLVWNAAFNPVSVLAGQCDTQTILDCKETRQLIQDVMAEVIAVANVEGYPISLDIITGYLTTTAKMGRYKTSMLLDALAGRPMEYEVILGNAIKLAKTHHIAVPRMETLYALLVLISV